MLLNKLMIKMKLEVEGSSPLSSVLTLLLYLSTLFHRVSSLVYPALILVSPRSPCLPTTRDVPSSIDRTRPRWPAGNDPTQTDESEGQESYGNQSHQRPLSSRVEAHTNPCALSH
jgi:hypothetical protein